MLMPSASGYSFLFGPRMPLRCQCDAGRRPTDLYMLCVYIYIYMYTHMCIYIYIYTHNYML